MRVLLVEDDSATAQSIEMMLRSESYVCDTTDMGEDGLEIGKLYDYDIIVLDLMLPDIDGYEVLRRLRAARVQTPILILSGLSGLDDKIKGLGVGADDYLTKPFAPKELSARIRALLRRARTSDPAIAHLRFGDLELIPEEGRVTLDGEEVHLTKTEFRLLVELASSPGRVFSREVLLERVWGYGYFGDGRLVDVHIRRLRTKIEPDPAHPRYVVTVRGLGYKLQS